MAHTRNVEKRKLYWDGNVWRADFSHMSSITSTSLKADGAFKLNARFLSIWIKEMYQMTIDAGI